ncbi:MAG: Mpo1-like protein [Panacagrimonas sp.]
MSQTDRVEYGSFAEFYHFYLGEHANLTCRRLHFIGTSLALLLTLYGVYTGMWWLLAVAFVQGYAWAWTGHFFFEHNRPATFKYPIRSYIGDWRMWWDTLTGKIRF